MKEQDKIEILIELSNTHRNQFNERRKYEWKVFLSSIGLYTAILSAKLTNGIPEDIQATKVFRNLVIDLTLIPAIASSIYLYFLHRANKVNQDYAHSAENELISLSGVSDLVSLKENPPKFTGIYWSLIWQIVILLLVGVLSLLILLFV